MRTTIVVQKIEDPHRAYDLFNFVRHLFVIGKHGRTSPEFRALRKDSPLDGLDTVGPFTEPTYFRNARCSFADPSRADYRVIFHFDGSREDLWAGTAVCMNAFPALTAIIITFDPGGPVTVARVRPGNTEKITTRVFPEILADQLEEEFAGTTDELDIVRLEGEDLLSVSRDEFFPELPTTS